MISYKPYTVSGVVKDVSTIAKVSYAEVWVSYLAEPFPEDTWAESISSYKRG